MDGIEHPPINIKEQQESHMRTGLAIAINIVVGSALLGLFYREIPPANHDVIILIIGGLITKLTDVYGYSFSTNATSARKDAMISTLVNTAQTTANTAQGGASDTLNVPTGQTATVVATDEGTTVKKDQSGE